MRRVRELQKIISELCIACVPPPHWRVPVLLVLGVACGLAATILKISKATSYLSDDPKAFINCHVMSTEYATWERGNHGKRAVCNDCHVPHDNVISKYAFKARDGSYHSFMFTFRLEPQVIKMHAPGRRVVQANCIRCHDRTVHYVDLDRPVDDNNSCWRCHRDVPHGRVKSLSATPMGRIPPLEDK